MEEFDEKQELKYLKHYTKLSTLLKILESNELLLGNPAKWDDKNDAASVEAYQRGKGAEKVRVLCVANGLEMVHHWFSYAKGKKGCCVMLNTRKFLAGLKHAGCFLHDFMAYYPAQDLTPEKLRKFPPDKIPFIKRRPYECEKEYRVIWTGGKKEEAPSIPLTGLIQYITLGPEFDEAAPDFRKLEKFCKENSIEIKRSRILESKEWIRKFKKLYL